MKKDKIKIVLFYANIVLFFAICFFSCFGETHLFSVLGKHFSISFYFSILAIPIFYFYYFFFCKNRFINRLIIMFIIIFITLLISSLGMAFIIYPRFNGLFQTSPPIVVLKESIKYAYDLALIPFFVFNLSIISTKILKRGLLSFLIVWIAFGYIQFFVYTINNEIIWKIYDGLDVLKIIRGSSYMFERIRTNYNSFRLYGFASEPATNCIIICLVFLPFLYYELSTKKTPQHKFAYSIMLFLTLFLGFLTKSSSVYAGMLVFAIFIIIKIYMHNGNKKTKIILACVLITSIVLLLIIPYTRNILINNVFLKIIDTRNYSTQHRYSTIWNDFLIFIKNPIFGIGDGNQGYFYSKHVVGTWLAQNPETQRAIVGELGLLGGGAFVPSFISGFGLFGLVIMFFSAKEYIKVCKKININYKKGKLFYIYTLVLILVLATVTTNIHRNYQFIAAVAIPFLCSFNSNTSKSAIAICDTKRKYYFQTFCEISV